jgi:hypothetical protein
MLAIRVDNTKSGKCVIIHVGRKGTGMKIIFVTKETVEWAWDRLQPQQRFMGNIGTCSVRLPWEDAVLVPIGSEVEFGSVELLPEGISLREFRNQISEGKYQKLELRPKESKSDGFQIEERGVDEMGIPKRRLSREEIESKRSSLTLEATNLYHQKQEIEIRLKKLYEEDARLYEWIKKYYGAPEPQ